GLEGRAPGDLPEPEGVRRSRRAGAVSVCGVRHGRVTIAAGLTPLDAVPHRGRLGVRAGERTDDLLVHPIYVAEDHEPANQVLELAHVARPVVLDEELHHGRGGRDPAAPLL